MRKRGWFHRCGTVLVPVLTSKALPGLREHVGHQRRPDAKKDNQSERGIKARQVRGEREEPQHLGRVGHAGDEKAQAELEAGEVGEGSLRQLRATEGLGDEERIGDAGEDGGGGYELEFGAGGVDGGVAGDVAGAGGDVLVACVVGDVGCE